MFAIMKCKLEMVFSGVDTFKRKWVVNKHALLRGQRLLGARRQSFCVELASMSARLPRLLLVSVRENGN